MATPAVSPTKKYTKGQLAERLAPRLKCATVDEFRSWLQFAPDRYEYPQSLLRTFCSDCTAEYREEMDEQGRCISDEPHPAIEPIIPEVDAAILQLRGEGKTAPVIAHELGIGARTVWRALDRQRKRVQA